MEIWVLNHASDSYQFRAKTDAPVQHNTESKGIGAAALLRIQPIGPSRPVLIQTQSISSRVSAGYGPSHHLSHEGANSRCWELKMGCLAFCFRCILFRHRDACSYSLGPVGDATLAPPALGNKKGPHAIANGYAFEKRLRCHWHKGAYHFLDYLIAIKQ